MQPNKTPELTILMPCLNEAETLGICIRKALGWLETSGVEGEVLVADNGSTDGSVEIAEKEGARVARISEKGYGSALYGGIREARGTYVIMGDADDSYDFSSLSPFITELRKGRDLVMGNRFRGGIAPGAMPWLHRYVGNPILSAVGRALFRSECRDFHCGLRGFSRKAVLGLDLQTTGMEFASEMVVKATLRHLDITEVPVTLSKDGRSRPPHLRSWRDGWRHLRFLLLHSPRWLFLYPGLFLVACGLIVSTAILLQPVQIGSVSLGVHTLLASGVAVIVGVQLASYGILTRTIATQMHMLSENRSLRRLTNSITLENGLLAGLALSLLGLGICVYTLVSWELRSFGPLDPTKTMRLFIPGLVILVVGIQIVFTSFFLSVIALSRKGS